MYLYDLLDLSSVEFIVLLTPMLRVLQLYIKLISVNGINVFFRSVLEVKHFFLQIVPDLNKASVPKVYTFRRSFFLQNHNVQVNDNDNDNDNDNVKKRVFMNFPR